LVFFVVALALLLAEILTWWLTSPLRKHDQFHSNLEAYSRHLTHGHHLRPKHTSLPGLATSKFVLSYILRLIETAVSQSTLFLVRLLPSRRKEQKLEAMKHSIREHFGTLQNLTTRNWLQRVFFTPLECSNMIWASYLIFAQTIGAFNNCACMTSSWGGIGGYVDFTQFPVADSPLVVKYWIQGTVVTCVVMGLGMGYIVLEVCDLICPLLPYIVSTDMCAVAYSSSSEHRELSRCHDWSTTRAPLSSLYTMDTISCVDSRSNGQSDPGCMPPPTLQPYDSLDMVEGSKVSAKRGAFCCSIYECGATSTFQYRRRECYAREMMLHT
jgi:hypothetical protein